MKEFLHSDSLFFVIYLLSYSHSFVVVEVCHAFLGDVKKSWHISNVSPSKSVFETKKVNSYDNWMFAYRLLSIDMQTRRWRSSRRSIKEDEEEKRGRPP